MKILLSGCLYEPLPISTHDKYVPQMNFAVLAAESQVLSRFLK